LRNKLASDRLDRQKEIQDIRTRIAAAEANLADAPAATPKGLRSNPNTPAPAATANTTTIVPPPAAPILDRNAYSNNGKALLDAVAKAKLQLEEKEQALTEKDKTIASLQARFDEIQLHLASIQIDLAAKNAQLKEIQNNLQGIQKP